MNNIGIYKITCKTTGQVYIGSSKELTQRFKNHILALEQGKHSNEDLQEAWNKYGEEAFTYQVIERCSLEDRFARERFHIKSYPKEKLFNRTIPTGKDYAAALSIKADRALIQRLLEQRK
jgi:group I intron endonuclease